MVKSWEKKLNLAATNSKMSIHIVEKRKISYFGLALNLFQHLISPNQDYLSYSARTIFPSSTKNWRKPAKLPLPQKSSMGTDVLSSAPE